MYDPLSDTQLPSQQAPVASYWEAESDVNWPSTTQPPSHTDVLVIGAGYTGLNAARCLAKDYQQQVTVIEANRLAWGCSSRNAGFVMKSTGRLGLAQWAEQFGHNMAEKIAAEHQLALDKLQQRIAQRPDKCDPQTGGYLKLAHRTKAIPSLKQQYQQLKAFGQNVSWLEADEVSKYLHSECAHAALKFNDCFALNPLKLASATAEQAAQAGVQLVDQCSAQRIERLAEGWRVHTNQGPIDCQKLLVCTNAYTANRLIPALQGRSLPALSSIITTAPLSEQQLASTGLKPEHAYMDTRTLKYYFRLLPDNRLLFGGRGAIRGRDADKRRYAEHLLSALKATFPGLQSLQSWQYFWSGWVSVSFDDYPRVGAIGDNLYASMGYCGAGVSFSSLAGERLAQAAMGECLPALPYYQTPLKPFPMASMRRLGQWAYYHYARLTE